jgi:hypothetical protein
MGGQGVTFEECPGECIVSNWAFVWLTAQA